MLTQVLVGLVFGLVLNPSQGSATSFTQKEIIGKIVGGVPVDIEKLPHSVYISNKRKNNRRTMCGGSILNAYTVLSAAHCFDVNQNPSLIKIFSGARFLYDPMASVHQGQLLVMHERFNSSRILQCDIALVFLRNPITFSNVAQKAIIVNTKKWMKEKEKNFTISGWGRTEYKGNISEILLMAQMRYVSRRNCRRIHRMPITKDMFCLFGDRKRDACKGDSGGGVIWRDMIVGIVSHGKQCSKERASVYANVWYFRKWIKKHIYEFGANYCYANKKIKSA